MRIGYGYDVHKLVKGRKLIIGGVEIPHDKGLEGYSDADVLLHAIIDALIGAMAEGDIGKHCPAGNEKYKAISSLKLLAEIRQLLSANGYMVGNIDSTVVIESPRLSPFIENIRFTIAKALDIAADQVNVKAKTEEGLGFTGKGEGVAAHAVCLIHRPI